MSDKTKAVNLTEDEIKTLIQHHGYTQTDNFDERIERMNYLNKRLKAFKEPETEIKSDSSAAGWGASRDD